MAQQVAAPSSTQLPFPDNSKEHSVVPVDYIVIPEYRIFDVFVKRQEHAFNSSYILIPP
jgi:hypothetical protein